MHNGFLQVEGKKMAKSEGNFVTIHDLLADWPGEVLRLNMLRTHYRQPIDWTLRGLEESMRVLDRWHLAAGDSKASTEDKNPFLPKVLEPLLDDLNTPGAIAAIHCVSEEVADDHEGDDRGMFRAALQLLGLLGATETEWRALRAAGVTVDEAKVEAADRRPQRCARSQEIRRGRQAAGRARRYGRGAERRSGRHDMGGEAMTDFRMTGGCQCGAVRYALLSSPTTRISAIAACARRRSARSSRR